MVVERIFHRNIGDVDKTDEMNIKHFMNKNSIGYPLDIARTLETVNKAFKRLINFIFSFSGEMIFLYQSHLP